MSKRLAALALLLFAALPAGGQSLVPGVGLVERPGRVVSTSKRPPGCPVRWNLNISAKPWAATGTDPYVGWSAGPEFRRLYELRYSGGHKGTDGRDCRLGGAAGADPHGVNGPTFLAALCEAGPVPGVVTGSPATHTCKPTARELADLSYSAGVYDVVSAAYANLGGQAVGCSQGWECDPIPPSVWNDPKWRKTVVGQPEAAGNCYRAMGWSVNRLWYVPSPRCLSLVTAPPPPPPPPPGLEPVCGDGVCEAGEDCPADCEVVEPPPPPDCPDVAPCEVCSTGRLELVVEQARATLAAAEAALELCEVAP